MEEELFGRPGASAEKVPIQGGACRVFSNARRVRPFARRQALTARRRPRRREPWCRPSMATPAPNAMQSHVHAPGRYAQGSSGLRVSAHQLRRSGQIAILLTGARGAVVLRLMVDGVVSGDA